MTESNLSPEFRPVIKRRHAFAKGLKKYFTGKPCPRGHVVERHTSNRACIICASEDAKIWQKENPENYKKIKTNYRENNKDKILKAEAAYRKQNKDKVVKINAAWRAANPEKIRCLVRAYCARKRNAEGQHTAADIRRIFDAQRGKCGHCLTGIKAGYHVDHIQPLARGGSNWPRNLQLLCAPCNQRKSAADPIDFARREGRLV